MPDRILPGEPPALRSRAIHVENRVEPAAAATPADVGLKSVPRRNPGDLRRSLRRSPDTDLGI